MKIFRLLYCISWIGVIVSVSCSKTINTSKYQPDATSVYFQTSLKPFYHGVASGDPLQNAVIIWTRVTPEYNAQLSVTWQVSRDSLFANVIQKGVAKTDSTKDFTVKVDVTNLAPDTYYYYKFAWKGLESVVGRTKTLPVNPTDAIKLIAISCNAYEGGYFSAYRKIGERKDRIDAILHLGDYIYEGFLERFMTIKDRIPLPKRKVVTLHDYRTRYAQYRLDPDLQKAHQMHPFINIWDDHEISNDAYKDGAEGHNSSVDGDYSVRKSVATSVFYEWLPIREAKTHYRTFDFGTLAQVYMLDERLAGKTEPKSLADQDFYSQERAMLGKQQFEWLVGSLAKSKAQWKIIGNQVIFSDLDFTPVRANNANQKIDQWTGYPYERKTLLTNIQSMALSNLLFLTGDSHCSWAFEIPVQVSSAGMYEQSLGVEFGTPSISSGNWGTGKTTEVVKKWEEGLLKSPANQHLKYVNLKDHGYILLTLTKEKAKADWYYVEAEERTTQELLGKSAVVMGGTNKITLISDK